MKLTSTFLSRRKFRVSVEGEMSTPRDIQEGVPQSPVLSPILHSNYTNNTWQTHGVYKYLCFFVGDACIYATDMFPETLIDASKYVGLEVNSEKTKYIYCILLSRHQNAEQNPDIKIGNYSSPN
jgi:hypothetical protein